MDQDHQAEEIRRAMAEVRRKVDGNTAEVLNHAREMADWRYHVRKYPKMSLAAAAAIGYLLVPAKGRRRAVGQYAADRSPGTGKVEPVRQASLVDQLLSTAARLVIRNGVPFVAHEAIRMWQQRRGRPAEAEVDSPPETPSSPAHQP